MDKEAIARIIDPQAFRAVEERLEGLPDWVKRRNANDPARQARAEEMARDDFLHDGPDRNGALAKATAILALQPSERERAVTAGGLTVEVDDGGQATILWLDGRWLDATPDGLVTVGQSPSVGTTRQYRHSELATLSPAEPSPESREGETAWLIEHGSIAAPTYWTGRTWGEWSSDHKRACRFARRKDAHKVSLCLGDTPNDPPHRIAEHKWISK